HLVAVLELHPEHGVREWLDDRPLHEDRIVLGLRQGEPPTLPLFPCREQPTAAQARPLSISPSTTHGEASRGQEVGGPLRRWAARCPRSRTLHQRSGHRAANRPPPTDRLRQ